MKQQSAAVLFPAASVVVIAVWAIGLAGWNVPAEVSAAMTSIVGFAAVWAGWSRDTPPVDPVTAQQEAPRKRRRARKSP